MKSHLDVAAVVALSVVSPGCFLDCKHSISHRLVSPDSSRVAVLYTRDCGAASSGGYHLSILDTKSSPSGLGNSLTIADTSTSVSRREALALNVTWQSDREIFVVHSPAARVIVRDASVGSVSITVRPATSSDSLRLHPW